MITRNFSHGPKWIPGIITKITGPVSYKVLLGDGNIVRRHVDQILARPEDTVSVVPPGVPEWPSATVAASENPILEENSWVPEGNFSEPAEPAPDKSKTLVTDNPPPSMPVQSQRQNAPVRQSQRRVSKPSYLKDFEC